MTAATIAVIIQPSGLSVYKELSDLWEASHDRDLPPKPEIQPMYFSDIKQNIPDKQMQPSMI